LRAHANKARVGWSVLAAHSQIAMAAFCGSSINARVIVARLIPKSAAKIAA
jgi:hypothetical protein